MQKLAKGKNSQLKGKLSCKIRGMAIEQELITFFQCMLYPKDMVKNDACNELSAELVKLIHKTLYNFSNNNLQALLQKSEAFRLVLNLSLLKKKEVFKMVLKNGKSKK